MKETFPTSFSNPPPIWVHKPKPENMTPKESEFYWREEQRKWIEGVDYITTNVGIPGTLYHFIQEQWIKHRVLDIGETAIARPICRDVDWMMHHKANSCMKRNKILLILKGTGVGLSTLGGSLAPYTAICYPGSNSLITSQSTNTLSTIFQDKIYEPMLMYDEDILERHKDGKKKGEIDFHLLNKSKQKCFLKINVKNFKNNSEAFSSIDCRETSEKSDSVLNFAGSGANYFYVDEFIQHQRKIELLKAIVSRVRDRNTRKMKGFILLGGAMEIGKNKDDKKEKISQQDIAEVKKLITPKSLEAWDMEYIFLPFWMGQFGVNGHSDEKKGMEWWEKEAEKKIKDPDPDVFRTFKRENPRTEADLFDNIVSSLWESDVAEKIKLQYEEVVSKDVPTQECSITVIGDTYKFDPNGKSTYILESPKELPEYYITIDGVQTSELTSHTPKSERSMIAAVVTKMIDPATHPYMPVCIFAEHPQSLESSCYKIIDIIKYYNKFGKLKGINAERNVGFGEFFGSVLVREGYGKLIVMKKDFSASGFKDSTKWFYYNDENNRAFQFNQANAFLRRNISSIQMLPLLEDMMKMEGENADILDAWLGFFNTVPDVGIYRPKVAQPIRQRETTHFVMRGGKMEIEVRKVADSPLMNQFNNQFIKN